MERRVIPFLPAPLNLSHGVSTPWCAQLTAKFGKFSLSVKWILQRYADDLIYLKSSVIIPLAIVLTKLRTRWSLHDITGDPNARPILSEGLKLKGGENFTWQSIS